MLIHAASGDAVLQEAQLLARHATECGVDARIRGLSGADPVDFHIFWSFLPEARDAIDEIGRFVRTVTSTPGVRRPPTRLATGRGLRCATIGVVSSAMGCVTEWRMPWLCT